jgi:hypothetical protein
MASVLVLHLNLFTRYDPIMVSVNQIEDGQLCVTPHTIKIQEDVGVNED